MKRILISILTLAILLGLFPAITASANTGSTFCQAFHEVQRGDTLTRIARSYQVTVKDLMAWNALSNPNRIRAGEFLCIRPSVIVDDTPPSSGRVHVVQAGETLARIARQYGVDLTVLARVNNIANPNYLRIGQSLTIPDVTIQ